MMDLPPGWTRYTTDEGKDYYHNAETEVTQWHKPEFPQTASFGSTSEVYQYQPSVADLELSSLTQKEPASPAGTLQPVAHTTVSPASSLGNDCAPGASLRESQDGIASDSSVLGKVIAHAQTFFDVSTDDVTRRVRFALLPALKPDGSVNDFRANPDFWGPFWIATTAVLFLSATGNFAQLLELVNGDNFTSDYGLMSVAAGMLYGCLIGVPAITRGLLYLSGQEADSINFKQLICVYGYSLTAAIPTSLICIAPIEIVRWAAIAAGLAVSLLFIRNHLWSDISIEAPGLKWATITVLGGAQATIFVVYRLYFFTAHGS